MNMKAEEILTRAVENVIPNKEELKKVLESGRKLNVYVGIDPTATKIHIGHLVPLRKLKALVDLGHKVTFLIGDFTALIGDTSDKDSERPVLTYEQIEENFQTYKRQAEKVLDFDKVELRHNSEWLKKLSFEEIVKLCQHFSIGDFVGRELIKKRLVDGKSVKLHEVLYPVMQGYDSYFMDTDLQIGGTDQTFNMQAGRTLQKDLRNKDSYVMALGFLTGTDGRKMSKSWGNAIWVEDTPEEMFGKVMSIRDDLILEYWTLGTAVEMVKVEEVKARLASGENPMAIKRELAREIVRELCGEDKVRAAEEYFDNASINKTASEVDPEYKISSVFDIKVLGQAMVGTATVSSMSEAKRLLDEGAIYLNDKRLDRNQAEWKIDDGKNVLRVGKRKYIKLIRE